MIYQSHDSHASAMEPKPIAFAPLNPDEIDELPARVKARLPATAGEGAGWMVLRTSWPLEQLVEQLDRLDQVIEAWAETQSIDLALLRLADASAGPESGLMLANLALRKQYLDETRTLTAGEVHDLSGLLSRNRSEPASRWKKEGKAFAVRVGRRDLYPAFQFEDGAPRPVMRGVLAALPGTMTPWQTAFWFASGNGWLDGDEPQHRLNDAEQVVEAARRLADPARG